MSRSRLLILLVFCCALSLTSAQDKRKPGRGKRPRHPEREGYPRPGRRDGPGRDNDEFEGDCDSRGDWKCEFLCKPASPGFYYCVCKSGFYLKEDGRSCALDPDSEEDTDEPRDHHGFPHMPRPDGDEDRRWPPHHDHPGPGHRHPRPRPPGTADHPEGPWRGDDVDDSVEDKSIEGHGHGKRHRSDRDSKRKSLLVGLAGAFAVFTLFAIALTVILCCVCRRNKAALMKKKQLNTNVAVIGKTPSTYYSSISNSHHYANADEVATTHTTPPKAFPQLEKEVKAGKKASSNVYVEDPLEFKATQ